MTTKVAYRVVLSSEGHPTVTTCGCVVDAPTEANAITRAKKWAEEKHGIPVTAWHVDVLERIGVMV